ncbi:MAG: hypothetical protein ABIK43_02900 [candidate division WOR-3 bacterium]
MYDTERMCNAANRGSNLLPAMVLLLCACSAPYLAERATITEEDHNGFGIVTGIIPWARVRSSWMQLREGPFGPWRWPFDSLHLLIRERNLCAGVWVVGQHRQPISQSIEWSLRAGIGSGSWLTESDNPPSGVALIVNVGGAMKFQVLPGLSVRAGIGYPGLANITVLKDIGDRFTAFGWAQWLDAGVGIAHHSGEPGQSQRHFTLTIGAAPVRNYSGVIPTATFGFSADLGDWGD